MNAERPLRAGERAGARGGQGSEDGGGWGQLPGWIGAHPRAVVLSCATVIGARSYAGEDPTVYPEEERAGGELLQRWIAELLRPLLETWLNTRGEHLVGACRRCLVATFLLYACGDSTSDAGGTGNGTSASDATAEPSTSTSATGSTTEMQGCWRHVDGGLLVGDDSDLGELRNIVSVTGEFQIALQQNMQADLSFLECLESADMLFITGNVQSTAGMVRLSALGSVVVDAPSSLEAVEGLDGVEEIGAIILPLHHKVERLSLLRCAVSTN